MQLFHLIAQGVARDAGRSPIEFRADFPDTVRGLAAESNALLNELRATERFRAAMQKHEQRKKAKSEPNRKRPLTRTNDGTPGPGEKLQRRHCP